MSKVSVVVCIEPIEEKSEEVFTWVAFMHQAWEGGLVTTARIPGLELRHLATPNYMGVSNVSLGVCSEKWQNRFGDSLGKLYSVLVNHSALY